MSRWTHEFLAAKREIGDPLADDTVRSLFESDGLEALRAFGGSLVDEDGHPTEGLSEAMVRYLASSSGISRPTSSSSSTSGPTRTRP